MLVSPSTSGATYFSSVVLATGSEIDGAYFGEYPVSGGDCVPHHVVDELVPLSAGQLDSVVWLVKFTEPLICSASLECSGPLTVSPLVHWMLLQPQSRCARRVVGARLLPPMMSGSTTSTSPR